MTNASWRILLGPHWQRFTAEQSGLQMLGSVQRGAQIGALARYVDGRYVQLNGDHQTPLGGFQIERALRKAHAHAAPTPHRSSQRQPAQTPVTVVIKKRRVIATARSGVRDTANTAINR
jgi:hypothetical protein